MKVLKAFTVAEDKVENGAIVEEFKLEGAGVTIPAILVGEQGRGRALGVLPVEGAQPGGRVLAARVSQTRSGRPKLVAAPVEEAEGEQAIVVFRSPIGFRGSNEHGGPPSEKICGFCWRGPFPLKELTCPRCGAVLRPKLSPFPGKILVRGRIAQGAAGRMGGGEQLIALVPRGEWVAVRIGGRRYGQPSVYYYVFDGERLLVAPEGQEDLLKEVLEGGEA